MLISSVVGGLRAARRCSSLAVQRLAANDQFEYEKYEPFVTEPLLYERLLEGLQNTLHRGGVRPGARAAARGRARLRPAVAAGWFVRVPAVAVIEFFRGVPLLLLILGLFLAYPLVVGVELPAAVGAGASA